MLIAPVPELPQEIQQLHTGVGQLVFHSDRHLVVLLAAENTVALQTLERLG